MWVYRVLLVLSWLAIAMLVGFGLTKDRPNTNHEPGAIEFKAVPPWPTAAPE